MITRIDIGMGGDRFLFIDSTGDEYRLNLTKDEVQEIKAVCEAILLRRFPQAADYVRSAS